MGGFTHHHHRYPIPPPPCRARSPHYSIINSIAEMAGYGGVATGLGAFQQAGADLRNKLYSMWNMSRVEPAVSRCAVALDASQPIRAAVERGSFVLVVSSYAVVAWSSAHVASREA